jgi:hypothetical protein
MPGCGALEHDEEHDQAMLDGDEEGCEGHPAVPSDPMGVTVYCDGRCVAQRTAAAFRGEVTQ